MAFTCEFPVNEDTSIEAFFDVVRDWLLNSPHCSISSGDLNELGSQTVSKFVGEGDVLEAWKYQNNEDDSHAAAVLYSKLDQTSAITWQTEIAFSKDHMDTWIGIHIKPLATRARATIPTIRKPQLIGYVLNRLSGSVDGLLCVENQPHILRNEDEKLATGLLGGQSGGRLPVVYVSCGFDGSYAVDAQALASDLAGLAHVVVEPSRSFSRRLQVSTSSRNVYGGSIGIYWQDGIQRDVFYLGEMNPTGKALKVAICEHVSDVLANRVQLERTRADHVKSLVSSQVFNLLRKEAEASRSLEAEKYMEAFDSELQQKNAKILDLEQRLSLAQNRPNNAIHVSLGSNSVLEAPDDEQEFYDGEFKGILAEELKRMIPNQPTDSRRLHVLTSIANKNKATENPVLQRRNELKNALSGYSKMDAKTRSSLEAMGFSVTGDGKHYKLVYKGDDRYTFVLPKSGSDHRGSKNATADISRLMF